MNAFALLFMALMMLGKGRRRLRSDNRAQSDTPIRELIRSYARKKGIPERLALAIARAESNFNPSAEGDLRWHENRPRFERVVPAGSPYRSFPQLWHSYGLFQLLAPYWVHKAEHPRILLDPRVNTDRATDFLAKLQARYGSDWDSIRLAYTGAIGASPEVQANVLRKWHQVLELER